MTCNACGEKPKDTAKDFTRAVIEINNPPEISVLRKVVIPASIGTEEDVPAAVGKYRNVILHYEANKHTYLYSSDGIPTLLEMEIPQELLDRIEELEENLAQETASREDADEELQSNIDAVAQDLEDFKNSPDVVDIVSTYADLQAYDTSALGDKDEIRVLQDETHDGASAYYRWDKTNSQWIFIGITGPYYTKSEIDTTVQGIEGDIEDVQSKIGRAKVLTAEDYNWNSTAHSATEPYNCVALWLLPSGMYDVSTAPVAKYMSSASTEVFASTNDTYIIGQTGSFGKQVIQLVASSTTTSGYSPFRAFCITPSTGTIPSSSFDFYLYKAQNALDSNSTVAPLSAFQGQVLNTRIGDLSALTTTNKTSAVPAINELASEAISVVQARGTSTTDVMSQNATTTAIDSLVYPDTYKTSIRIGRLATVAGGTNGYSIAIGSGNSGANNTRATGAKAIAIGQNTTAGHDNSIAIGYGAATSADGEMNIGSTGTAGYNNSGYRLLTGLYDPQNAHDAATKGYVDASVSAIGAGTRKATSAGWNTSAPLNYILQQASSPTQAQGAMFYTGKTLSDFPIYAGIGIYSADTEAEPLPYLLTQTTSDDGLGTTTGNPAAYRLALHSEVPSTFTTNEWNALWA